MTNVEPDLLNQLRAGDLATLGELFAIHRERLLRMVNFRLDKRLTSRIDADDILQESFVEARRRVASFIDGDKSFYVWLRLIVLQTMIDLHRHHLGTQKRDARREQRKGPTYPEATSISLIRNLAGHILTPSQIAVKEESLSQLEQALDGMNPVDQEVLALRHFEELTNSEISELLGIEQKAASIRYVRAIARLRNALSDLPGFFGAVEGES
ncbi:MAG: sigma-70 family RNA polymerase sigma factor [Aureliella sp.]